MLEKNLIDSAREIQGELNTELKESQQPVLKIEDYEQPDKYIYYLKNGSPIKPRDVFSSYVSEVREMNLYVHIPFCVYRCTFCCCFSVGRQPQTIVEAYVNALKKELDLLIKTSRFENAVVRYIFFGGGTPTCLTAKQLTELIRYLKSRLNVLPDASFTCETSPDRIVGGAGKEKLQALLENGVNRISIGVQSFKDSTLKAIGRKHSSGTAMSAYRNAHEAGFTNTNIDLMYGLPGQTTASWESDLQIATELNPGWVSVYRLFFENPKIHDTYIREPDLFPDDETVLLMNIMAIEKLTGLGYGQSQAPSTFLLPSKLEYDPLITLGRKTLGLGVSAWSYFNGIRYYNFHDLNKYMDCVRKGWLPISFAGKYSKRQQIEREIVFMLRLPEGVNRSDFNFEFGTDIARLFSGPLQKLRKAGMIKDDGGTYRLSKKGLLFCAEVFKEFYSQDYVDRFKNVIYRKKFLKNLFLNKKYTKSVEAISNIVKTMAGSSK